MAAVSTSTPPKRRPSGVGWLVFLAIPPVVIVAGLVAMFAWEGSKGGITPKWRKPASTTATTATTATTVTATGTSTSTSTATGTNGPGGLAGGDAR